MKNLRRHDDGRLYWHWDPAFFTTSDLIEPLAFRDHLYAVCTAISVPVLLVKGMYSNVVTSEGVDQFRQHLPQLQVFEVSGAGHMITGDRNRSEEHTSELQSLMRISYAVFCLKKKKNN